LSAAWAGESCDEALLPFHQLVSQIARKELSSPVQFKIRLKNQGSLSTVGESSLAKRFDIRLSPISDGVYEISGLGRRVAQALLELESGQWINERENPEKF
jgi:hypothetical protein